jgi:hypothetical protein
MDMKTKNYLYWLYIAGSCVYVGYEWYSYTGLYRLAAEWQMSAFGSYSMKLTLLLPLLVLLIPGAVVAKLLGLEVNARRAAAVNASPRVVLVVGLVLVAVAAGAGWYGYGKASANVAFEAFDLSNAKVPPSKHVVMTGVAHTEFQVEFQKKSGGSTSLDRYIPITAANWRRGDPLVYFMKTNATVYMPPGGGKFFEFSQRTPPFPMTTQPGVLIEDNLPGPVAEVYHKRNVALASVPVILDLDTSADAKPYFITAGVGGIGGFCCLLTAAIMAIRHRRLPQT